MSATNKRNIILKALKTDLEEKLHSSNGYKTDPVNITRGAMIFEDVVEKPALCFYVFNDEKEEAFSSVSYRFLHVYILGFYDTDGYGDNSDDLHNLLDDVEYFIYNDFTYGNDTDVGDTLFFEGGVSEPCLEFRLNIRIRYKRATNTR